MQYTLAAGRYENENENGLLRGEGAKGVLMAGGTRGVVEAVIRGGG